MFKNLKELGGNKTIKFHYLRRHLNRFPDNLGYCRAKQDESFHQDMKTVEEKYHGRQMMVTPVRRYKRPHRINSNRKNIIFTILWKLYFHLLAEMNFHKNEVDDNIQKVFPNSFLYDLSSF